MTQVAQDELVTQEELTFLTLALEFRKGFNSKLKGKSKRMTLGDAMEVVYALAGFLDSLR